MHLAGAIEPAVAIPQDLRRVVRVATRRRTAFAQSADRPVGAVRESEHRLGERLLQRLGAVVLVQHEPLRPVRRRYGRLAVADERRAGHLAADRLHQEDRSLFQQKGHGVLLDRQVGDRVGGGGVETGLIESLEDVLAVAGEVEADRADRGRWPSRRSRRWRCAFPARP